VSMPVQAAGLVAQGITTREEVQRVLNMDLVSEPEEETAS
jgi:hypothetical protein